MRRGGISRVESARAYDANRITSISLIRVNRLIA
jgi:hypothetical protein